MFNAVCINPAGWSQRYTNAPVSYHKEAPNASDFWHSFLIFCIPGSVIRLLEVLALRRQQPGAQNGGPFGSQAKLLGQKAGQQRGV